MTEKYTPEKVAELVAEAREMDAGVQVTKYDPDARTFIKGPSIVAQLADALTAVSAERDSWKSEAEHRAQARAALAVFREHTEPAEERETRISLMDLIDEHRNGWVRKGSGSSADLADAIRARFTVFEKAHAPTDDEREALWNLIENDHVYETDYFRNGDLRRQGCSCGEETDWNAHGDHLIDAIFAAGFRRGAPAESAETDEPADLPGFMGTLEMLDELGISKEESND